MRDVWTLMAQYRPKDKRLKDKDVMTAWWLTFQPYGVDELKRAIGAYFLSLIHI